MYLSNQSTENTENRALQIFLFGLTNKLSDVNLHLQYHDILIVLFKLFFVLLLMVVFLFCFVLGFFWVFFLAFLIRSALSKTICTISNVMLNVGRNC